MPSEARFTVWGDPVPQGSWTAFLVRVRGKLTARAIPSNKKSLDQWRKAIRKAAETHMGDRPPFTGAVIAYLFCAMPLKGASPKSPFWRFPIRKGHDPDVDKLARAVFDGITGTVIHDDVLIVTTRIDKRYEGRTDSLPRPGVRIIVREIEPEALDV